MAEQKKSVGTRKGSTTATASSKASAAPKKSGAAPKSAAAKSTATKATKAPAAPRRKSNGGSPAASDTNEAMRQRMIREAAYYRALNRGFSGAAEMDDWLVAEREIDSLLGRLSG